MNWAETFLTKVIQAARMAYRLRDGLSVLLSDPKASPAFLALMIYTEDPDRQLLNKSSRVS